MSEKCGDSSQNQLYATHNNIVVDRGSVLRLEQGAKLLFHAGALLTVIGGAFCMIGNA